MDEIIKTNEKEMNQYLEHIEDTCVDLEEELDDLKEEFDSNALYNELEIIRDDEFSSALIIRTACEMYLDTLEDMKDIKAKAFEISSALNNVKNEDLIKDNKNLQLLFESITAKYNALEENILKIGNNISETFWNQLEGLFFK